MKKVILYVLLGILLLVIAFIAFLGIKKHSTFSSNYLYSKDIQIGDEVVRVTVTEKKDGDMSYAQYDFYSGESESKSLVTIESQMQAEYDSEKHNDPFLSLKDITGDGIPEILVMVERSGAGNQMYEIIDWNSGSPRKIQIDSSNGWIGFDEIEYKNGYVYVKDHGSDVNVQVKYQLISSILVPVKTIGFFATDTGCEIKESIQMAGKSDWYVVGIKNDCNIWTEDFDPYIETRTSGVYQAAQALLSHTPNEISSIDLIINTYYKLTLYYGTDLETIFTKSTLDFNEFFYPFFRRNVSDYIDDIPPPEYEAFRLAFFIKDSPAYPFDFPWRTRVGIGGSVVGKKKIDEFTMIVYGAYGQQAYMGAAMGCKGESIVIDEFTFKQIGSDWRIYDIKEGIDTWVTMEDNSQAKDCVEINQDKIKKYQI